MSASPAKPILQLYITIRGMVTRYFLSTLISEVWANSELNTLIAIVKFNEFS